MLQNAAYFALPALDTDYFRLHQSLAVHVSKHEDQCRVRPFSVLALELHFRLHRFCMQPVLAMTGFSQCKTISSQWPQNT